MKNCSRRNLRHVLTIGSSIRTLRKHRKQRTVSAHEFALVTRDAIDALKRSGKTHVERHESKAGRVSTEVVSSRVNRFEFVVQLPCGRVAHARRELTLRRG